MSLTINDPVDLAPDQRFVFDQLAAAVQAKGADKLYNALDRAEGGRIVSVDLARFLSPAFRTWDGRLRHTLSTANPAGAYAHDRLRRELARPRGRKRLLVTAGGAGSGKTSTFAPLAGSADLVFDNQLRSLDRAAQIVDIALERGWTVEIAYVHRPFIDVVRAVIERSRRTGRWNSLAELPRSHIEAQHTVLRLRRRFKPEQRRGRLVFTARFNASEGAGDRAPGARVLFRELDKGGPYHLGDAQEAQLKRDAIAVLAAAVAWPGQADVRGPTIPPAFARLLAGGLKGWDAQQRQRRSGTR